MKSLTPLLLLAICLGVVAGCGKRVAVTGSKYEFFTPDTLPDGHPGTVLRYQGKQVWPSIHSGYFNESPANFYHDGVFVFVGSVPSRLGRIDAQLFAIRDAGPPVLISQRVFHEPLTNSYFIDHIAPVSDGFRVVMKFWLPSRNNVTITNEISWPDIVGWLKEAESVPLDQTTVSETFRLLP